MQFKLAFVSIAGMMASLVGGIALPADVEAHEPEADAAQYDGFLFVCTESNFQGNCLNIGFNSQQCQNFPRDYVNEISSLSPTDGWNCHLLIDYNCISNEGEAWFSSPVSWVGYGSDQFKSFVCYQI